MNSKKIMAEKQSVGAAFLLSEIRERRFWREKI